MGSRLGRRVVYFANLPIKLLMPTSFTNITEIALKTIPSSSKVRLYELLFKFQFNLHSIPVGRDVHFALDQFPQIEIKRVLESLYGFDVEKVETLNMEGKKKKRGGLLLAKPDYKKAYVTLRTPLSINPELFPIRAVEDDKKSMKKESESSILEDPDAVKKSHWLDDKREGGRVSNSWTLRRRFVGGPRGQRSAGKRAEPAPAPTPAKFPWSSMKGFSK